MLSERERNTFRNICTLDTPTEKVFGSITLFTMLHAAQNGLYSYSLLPAPKTWRLKLVYTQHIDMLDTHHLPQLLY